jgi:hypothetical protein
MSRSRSFLPARYGNALISVGGVDGSIPTAGVASYDALTRTVVRAPRAAVGRAVRFRSGSLPTTANASALDALTSVRVGDSSSPALLGGSSNAGAWRRHQSNGCSVEPVLRRERAATAASAAGWDGSDVESESRMGCRRPASATTVSRTGRGEPALPATSYTAWGRSSMEERRTFYSDRSRVRTPSSPLTPPTVSGRGRSRPRWIEVRVLEGALPAHAGAAIAVCEGPDRREVQFLPWAFSFPSSLGRHGGPFRLRSTTGARFDSALGRYDHHDRTA